jgi:protocatechuate 3,4-dioxygenase beta subunit
MKILIILTALLSLNATSPEPDAQILPTKLRITVIDGLGNIVEGAEVAIYDNEKNYLASENPVQTLKTDKKGRVTFKDVKTIQYFIEAKKGDQNNNGEGVVTGKLIEGKINKVNTVIE